MSVQAQQQRVEVQLSTHRVSVDESVILNVRAYGMDSELDASALNNEFDVTQRSSSRQVTIENGKRTSLVEWVLELIPKRTGALEVPPVFVGAEASRPLTLLVEQPASGAARDLYLEASVDVINPYVQAQVIYTLRVFQDVRFLDASLQVPEVEGLIMQQLADEKNYQETVNGRTYTVSEIRYSVFPQQSGDVVIPPLALQAVVPVDRQTVPNTRTRTKRVTRRANEIELDVQARPDGLAGNWWLPAKEVRLQSEWSSPIDSLVVDQPVTRTIHLMATGVGDTQLPELSIPEVANISVYADSPTAATNTSERGLISQQTNTWAVIPQVAGTLVLPELRVNWFDTTTGEARTAILPEENLTVAAGAAAGSGSSALDNPNSDALIDQTEPTLSSDNVGDTDALVDNPELDSELNELSVAASNNDAADAMSSANNAVVLQAINRWRNLAFALLAGWVVSLVGLWIWLRRRYASNVTDETSNPTESTTMRFRRRAGSRAALDSVKTACESADASKISKEVLSWAAMVWPGSSPTHISDVAVRLKSPALVQAFEAIDAQQYRPSGSVKPVAVESIPELLRNAVDQYHEAEPTAAKSNALPSL